MDTIRLHEPANTAEVAAGLPNGFDYTYRARTIVEAIDQHVAATFDQRTRETYVLRNPTGDRLHFIIEALGGQFEIEVVDVRSPKE